MERWDKTELEAFSMGLVRDLLHNFNDLEIEEQDEILTILDNIICLEELNSRQLSAVSEKWGTTLLKYQKRFNPFEEEQVSLELFDVCSKDEYDNLAEEIEVQIDELINEIGVNLNVRVLKTVDEDGEIEITALISTESFEAVIESLNLFEIADNDAKTLAKILLNKLYNNALKRKENLEDIWFNMLPVI